MSVSRTTCPSCGAGLKSAAGFTPGQAVRCPKCATPFTVPEPGFEEVDDEPAPPPKKKAPPARASRPRDDDDDDRPRRRRPRDDDDEDDDDDRPRKKKKKTKYQEYKSSPVRFAILGVLLVVLGVLAFLLYQKKMREKEDAEGPAPAATPESGNRQVAPPVRPGPRGAPNPGDLVAGAGGPDEDAMRTMALRAKAQNDLKQIMLAMHNSSDVNGGTLPAAAVTDPAGRPLLSWRVAVLPYLEQKSLYDQFKMTEPWDSPANKPLVLKMPRVYQGSLPANEGKTAFKVFVGGGSAFDFNKGRKLSGISDGTSNTFGVVESGPPVEWTKPEDIPFDGKTAPRLEPLPLTGTNTVQVGMMDGAVYRLSLDRNPPDAIVKGITAGGGEVVQFQFERGLGP